jgi:hypothetical protein
MLNPDTWQSRDRRIFEKQKSEEKMRNQQHAAAQPDLNRPHMPQWSGEHLCGVAMDVHFALGVLAVQRSANVRGARFAGA